MKVVVKAAHENKPGKQEEKLVRLVSELTKLVNEEFTGHIKINFSQGGIGRIEKFEEILRGR